jgi:intein-encoded DNA endonuclease-like protein
MAYVLGFFAADGSMLKNKRGAHFIEFTIIDRIVLEVIQSAIGSTHKIKTRERNKGVWKTQYRLQIGSKEWFKDLLQLGLTPNKSNTIRFPYVPKRYLGDFVRGYFDGDGCVYFKKHYVKERSKKVWVFMTLFTCGNRSFLEDLHTVISRFDIKGGHISKKNRGYDLVFSRHDSLALYRLMYHTSKVTDMFLPRKRKKLEKAIKILKLDK